MARDGHKPRPSAFDRGTIDTNVPTREPPRLSLDVRPSTPKGRNIVLLLDGMGKEFCDKNSNIIKLHTVLKDDDSQLIYYSPGPGTVRPSRRGWSANIKRRFWMKVDEARAWNFDDFVCHAYKYLMDYYKPDDHVYIFGFSRGAYVARALAGMIQKVGRLLGPGNHTSVEIAYRTYKDQRAVGGELGSDTPNDVGETYRRIFSTSRSVVIEFLGAWDTVSSLGSIRLPRLPFAQGVQGVKFFRQALALDERRIRFTPEYIHYDSDQNKMWTKVRDLEILIAKLHKEGDLVAKSHKEKELEVAKAALNQRFPTDVMTTLGEMKRRRLDCWFMGTHSDVGGGTDLNGDPSLSNIPFRWIVREAVDCGLLISATGMNYLSAMALPKMPEREHLQVPEIPNEQTLERMRRLSEIADTRIKSRATEQDNIVEFETLRNSIPQDPLRRLAYIATLRDACAGPPTDDASQPPQESLKHLWWLLEVFPLETRRYAPDVGTVETKSKWRFNLGRPRQMVPGQRVHMSVHRRMTAHERHGMPRYRPRALLASDFFISWDDALADEEHKMWVS
ncbi:hypothetical protein CspHIS471_0313650 [Cutaneotrichosporon sp. HIS471]|nr:hypothetical protein CspHIS471_0313650 [Cutaneotrichosporon sp. HIS471]